jgi:hypothetical protein
MVIWRRNLGDPRCWLESHFREKRKACKPRGFATRKTDETIISDETSEHNRETNCSGACGAKELGEEEGVHPA